MHIKLPKYLDDFIFNELGGIYNRGWNCCVNTGNDDEANKKYIGTYFPRSFAENFVLFDDIISNAVIYNSFQNKELINILDIGSGTGGNLFGMLTAIHKYFGNSKTINIYSLDANLKSLNLQNNFLNKFKRAYSFHNINLNLIHHNISSPVNFYKEISNILQKFNIKFDIVTSSKCLSEFYNSQREPSNGLYQSFLKLSSEYISDTGLILVLEPTSSGRNYIPNFMNKEIREYVKENDDKIKIILPKSCARWYNKCNTCACYTQRVIRVGHKGSGNDKSNVCYALLAKSQLANEIVSNFENDISYITCSKYYKGNYIFDGICFEGIQKQGNIEITEKSKNALKLNNYV